MAFTVTNKQSVFGNQRVVMLDVTADAATQTIETGLKKVNGFYTGPKSMNSTNFKMAANSNASGVQSFGVLAITGVTSGDNMFIVVYGE